MAKRCQELTVVKGTRRHLQYFAIWLRKPLEGVQNIRWFLMMFEDSSFHMCSIISWPYISYMGAPMCSWRAQEPKIKKFSAAPLSAAIDGRLRSKKRDTEQSWQQNIPKYAKLRGEKWWSTPKFTRNCQRNVGEMIINCRLWGFVALFFIFSEKSTWSDSYFICHSTAIIMLPGVLYSINVKPFPYLPMSLQPVTSSCSQQPQQRMKLALPSAQRSARVVTIWRRHPHAVAAIPARNASFEGI